MPNNGNPFSVDVPSLTQALTAGAQGYNAVKKQRDEAEGKQAQTDAADLFQKGDYQGGISVLARAGKIDGSALATYGLAQRKLDAEKEASSSVMELLGGLRSGGGGAPPAAPSPTYGSVSSDPGPAVTTARPTVPSSPKVWGDREAEDAGLYDKPTPTAQPSAAQRLLGQGVASTPPPPAPAASTRVASAFGAMPSDTVTDAPARPAFQSNTTGGALPGQAPEQVAQRQAQAQPQSGVVALPGGGATFGGTRLSAMVPQLVAAASMPNLPAGQRTMVNTLLKAAIDHGEAPAGVKEYLFATEQARAAGQQPLPYDQWDLRRRQAGATAITNDMRGENAESQAFGKASGERAAAMMASAGAAGKGLQQLSRIEGLLGQVSQGKLEPGRMSIAAWGKSLGLNDDFAEKLGLNPKSVGDTQALQSMIAESVLSKIGSGGLPANNFSDADREFLVSTLPRLSNDPRANKILIDTARRVYQSDIERARAYGKFRGDPANKGKGFADFELDYSDKVSKADQFGDLRKQAEAILGPSRDVPNTINSPGAQPQRGAAPPPPGAYQWSPNGGLQGSAR